MAIPDFQSLMLPFLEALGDGRTYANRDLDRRLAGRYQLSEAELSEILQSGTTVATYVQLAEQRDQEHQRAERLAAQLRTMGVEPEA